jgi:4-hydroxy-tetrahydrodipicolinate synthase
MNVNFIESNPIPVKAAMGLMGLLDPVFRLPLVPPSDASLAKIEKVLESLGLLEKAAMFEKTPLREKTQIAV